MAKHPKICMIVQHPLVKGGIAAVVGGYRGSILENDYQVRYVESYMDGDKYRKLFKAIAGYVDFLRVLLMEKPELVHIHSSFGPSFYRKLPFIYMASWFKVPIINHCHGADFDSFYINASPGKKKLVQKAYNKCTTMLALSTEWKERLSTIVQHERIEVIENYSRIHEDAIQERANRSSNHQILFLGEIGQRKGCYDIPAVVERVARKFPSVKFVLGGSGDIESVRHALFERGVEQHVLFPGWVRGEDKDRLLRESDIFFLPSYNEGMPMAILDAMGYGMPVVSTCVGGVPKIVHDGKNGYACKPGDVEKLSDALIKMLQNEELCRQYGDSSVNIVRQGYSFEGHINRLTRLYQYVLTANKNNQVGVLSE
ncbi:glycosyltransferase family 4 protein [Paenibacillus sp. CF384]|uniref:glycosyltransferase family 4 protein n=1 Tax=Paenibacillus sp. CF384 TaxID=1884382 RepID=UPI0008949BB7|nr:glycosyltransferase family 4 protein [Paenibacillus sp. CF384]SDX65658.1 Glycosyltransferase involved in cell wall bisynthesis [Paenibacillus sp. CF384]